MNSEAPSAAPPGIAMAACYGFLALPLAFAGLPLYIHMPDFYTREMGLGIASAGFILMLLRLVDAIQDPLIGYISDKSAGFQKAVMVAGILTLLAGMGALLMGPPPFTPVAAWFAGAVAMTALGLSMSSINLVMIGSLWSNHEAGRARAAGMRESMTLIGMLLASVTPSVLMLYMNDSNAFRVFYLVFFLLVLIGSLAFIRFYASLPADHEIFAKKSGTAVTKLPFKFFRRNSGFLCACFLTHVAASLPAVLFLYFVTDLLGAGDKAGLFLFLYFLSGAAFMPLWLRMSRSYSAETAWLISMMVASCSFIWAFTLNEGALLSFGAICVISGASLGADLALPPVILARRLGMQKGTPYATQAYAVLNLISKIALALGTGCALLALDKAGFVPSQANTPDSLQTLAALYALLPCLVKGVSAFIVFHLDKGVKNDFQKRSSNDGNTHGS